MDAIRERRHVLFVDDEPASHRLIAGALRDENVRLTCVGDGARALHVLEQEDVDLLITPLTMPLMDGIELLRHIANRRLNVQVIVATGAEPPRRSQCSPLAFLREPVRAEPLVALVREHLARRADDGVGPAELATVIALERRSCALHVHTDSKHGVLLFAGGVPVDAAVADLRGDAAAREVLACRSAVLRLDNNVRAREFTVTTDLATLLRDAEATRALRWAAASAPPPPIKPTLRPAPATPAPPAATANVPTAATTTSASVPVWERPGAQAPIAALIAGALEIDGALGAALAVWELDQILHSAAVGDRLGARGMQAAVSGNSRVIRATMSTMARLGLRSTVEDVLITLDDQLHVLSPLPRHDGLFLHLVLDRQRSNLALARLRVRRLIDGFSLA